MTNTTHPADLCETCAHSVVCRDYEARPWTICVACLPESPKETPMPELKPCPIPNCGAKAEYLLEGNARCSDHDCPLGRAGTWIPVAAWQALPRPEKGEEVRECATCFFVRRVALSDPCETCDWDNTQRNWRPNRPGDEGRIREIVETCEYIGVSRPTLYRWMKDPVMNFPKPLHIGRRSGWRSSDIDHWLKVIAS
jgi:excisionase family DNA binding protein